MLANKIPNNITWAIKQACYPLFILVSLLPIIAWWMAENNGNHDFYAWWPTMIIFILIPALDIIIGKENSNPSIDWNRRPLTFTVLPMLALPLQTGLLFFMGWVFSSNESYSLVGKAGLIVSLGIVNGINNINIAHELIHKNSKIEQFTGGLLLSQVIYAGFKIEHIRGHHVDVSTPKDASSAPFGMNLYHFLIRAIANNTKNAWLLEKKKLVRQNKAVISLNNELICWYGCSILWLVVLTVLFGTAGAIFFLLQAIVAFSELEIINYVEHYGLERKLLGNGRYERTRPIHSWNSNNLLTNILLFQLQRHSDHHAFPKRPYEMLRHHEEAPQLPTGYGGMVLLALFPPLWMRIMNPKVKNHLGNTYS